MHRRIVVAAAALAASCGGTAPHGTGHPSIVGVSSSASLPVDATALPLLPDRVPLGEAKPTSLEISLVLPVWGDDSAVAVSQFSGQPLGYARRIDGATLALGPIIVLDDEPISGAFARGDDLVLATTHGGSVCLTTYRGADIVDRGCELRQGDALIPFADRFLSVWAEPADEAAEKRASRNTSASTSGAKPPAPRPAPKPAKKPVAKKHTKSPPAVAASPKKMAVIRQFVTSSGALDGDDAITALTFDSPMPGMDIVGATSAGARARILFYEYTGAAKHRPKNVIGKSRLALASLDEKGEYDPASRKPFPDDDLMFGFLANHQDPRVVSTSRGALYLGLTSSHGKCEAAVVSPFFMQMIPNDDVCAVEPAAYFDIANAVRDAQKSGSNGGKSAMPEAPASDASLKAARRAWAQPAYDPQHAAFYGEHAYAIVGDEVVRFSDPAKVEHAGKPFESPRLRLAWGAFAPDGSGIAATERGLVSVDASGAVTSVAGDVDSTASLLDRPDVSRVERRLAVKVGDAFYQSRETLRELAPERKAAIATLAADSAVLVGGRSSGLLVEVAGGALDVERFEPGRPLAPLARVVSPVGPGFDATERASGGAIVAGPKRGDGTRTAAFVVDATGRASAPFDLDLALPPDEKAVRVVGLPSGGAIVTDLARTRVVWLDDDARPLASAAWPDGASAARCVDGRPAPTEVPSPRPGVFVHAPALALDGACVTSDLVWAPDGSLRWFGSTAAAPDTRAELGISRGLVAPPNAPAPRASTIAALPAAPAAPRCPADMVDVAGEVCVDRYEATLVEVPTGRWLSPDYSSEANFMSLAASEWSTKRERTGDLFARAMPLPPLPAFEEGGIARVVAISRAGVRPSGYVTGVVARAGCEAAGKRLCNESEWKRACRGESDTPFPYGPTYVDGSCNVNREAHPAAILHGHSSMGHLDPRLDRVASEDGPLMRTTGETPTCASRWGDDAIYDMNGNLDEWIDDKTGAFAGGFFSRGTRNGCDALVDAHPAGYLDYSTGIRCCKDPAAP